MLIEVFSLSPFLITLFSVLLFFLGASVGSFMEVVRIRYSWQKTFVGRSRCAECARTLQWYELLPVASFLFQRGKCSECSCCIPRYHLISEIVTGLLFVGAFLLSDSLVHAGIISISAVFIPALVFADLERMEVPEHLSLPFAYLTLGIATMTLLHTASIAPVLSGIVLAAPFFLLWVVSAGRAMGLGDAKVALSLGFLLASPLAAISVFLLTFWIGVLGLGVYVLYQYMTKKKMKLRSGMRVPLIPSMALAFYLVLFTELTHMTILTAVGS